LLVLFTGITAIISSLFILGFILNLIPFCPLCLLIHIINLTIFFILARFSSKSIKESIISFYSGLVEFFFTDGPIPGKTRQQIVPLLLIAAVGLIFYQWIFMQFVRLELKDEYSFDELHVFEEYEKENFVIIPSSPSDPVAGPADAPVYIVIFSDFECSGCKGLSDGIKTLLNKYRTELKVVYKHYPLSSQCNESLKSDLHPHSCQAAFAADAANRQGKFWEYHDLLFSSKIYGEEEEFLDYAEELNLDISRFNNDMNTSAREKVAEDVKLGNELGIGGTPTVYLNGRKVSNLSMRTLDWLIETMYEIIKNQTPN